MDFKIEKKQSPAKRRYVKSDIDLAYEFAKKIYKEFGSFLKAIVLFGSTARKDSLKNDIDMLVIVDDVSITITPEVIQTYRVIMERMVADTSTKIHVTTMRFSSFWEYVRAGDPVAINMLRDGVALIDTGFFDPLQLLLVQGRIRPTPESIWSYFTRAPGTLFNSKWHLLQATLDLYWAIIDASHAALMKIGEIPPSPSHVADLLDEKLASKRLIDKKHIKTMRNFYKLAKMIIHREVKEVSGQEYDHYYKEAKEYVNAIKKFIEAK